MQKAAIGNRVTVHYIGTLDNGRIFDQRDTDSPLTFTLGADEVFKALEEEIIGMRPGEVKNIHLSAEKAYGPRLEENLLKVSREMFPAERELRIESKRQAAALSPFTSGYDLLGGGGGDGGGLPFQMAQDSVMGAMNAAGQPPVFSSFGLDLRVQLYLSLAFPVEE